MIGIRGRNEADAMTCRLRRKKRKTIAGWHLTKESNTELSN